MIRDLLAVRLKTGSSLLRVIVMISSQLLATSCKSPATQIQLFIDTDAPIDRPVNVEVFSFVGSVAPNELGARANGASLGSLRLTRMISLPDTFTAGGSIGVLPPQDRANNTVTLWIRATLAATASAPQLSIDRTARVSFVRGRSATARVFLPLRCGDLSVGCLSVAAAECTVSVRCREQNATCGDLGECVEAEIPVVVATSDGGVTSDLGALGIDATSGRSDTGTAGDGAVSQPPFPRPIAPISLGDVSLRRPTLRWELPAGTDGAAVELCRDRACTMVIESLRAMGTSVRPTMALPANNVVFWRLRATIGTTTSMTFSPTWLFHVPARDNSGGIDTSANAHLDVNGDGLDDVVVGVPFSLPALRGTRGSARVFLGNPMGLAVASSLVLEGPTDDFFGKSVATAGDINGDGFGDLVVGAPAPPVAGAGPGRAIVYQGSAEGLRTTPTQVLEGVSMGGQFGASVASAGDLNGDGFGDLVVGALLASPGGRTEPGTASVFHGSATGLVVAPARVFEGVLAGDQFGVSATSAGDLNGDGFGDLVIGASLVSPGGVPRFGSASVFHGSAMGLPNAPTLVLMGLVPLGEFGTSVASGGDVNGDGFGDLVVGALRAGVGNVAQVGTAVVFHGGAMGVRMPPARVLEGVAMIDQFGNSVASGGDVNGDGFGDLVVGSRFAASDGLSRAGTASVFLGSVTGIPMIPSRVLGGITADAFFGYSVAGAGDVNGDGFSDLVVGAHSAAPGGRTNAGTASVFYGSATGIPMAPARVFEGLVIGERLGYSVASASGLFRPFRTDHRLGSNLTPFAFDL